MNFEPARVRASPTTKAIIPMNFWSPKRTDRSTPHPARCSVVKKYSQVGYCGTCMKTGALSFSGLHFTWNLTFVFF